MSDETIEPPTDTDHAADDPGAGERTPMPIEQSTDRAHVDVDVANDRIDLDAIERDLDGVQLALERLADGTYWTDELSGAPIADETLAADPLARRA